MSYNGASKELFYDNVIEDEHESDSEPSFPYEKDVNVSKEQANPSEEIITPCSSSNMDNTAGKEGLPESKFAQLIGFGNVAIDDSSPVTMATLELTGHLDNNAIATGSNSENSSTVPNPYYQVGQRVVDYQWAMNYQEAAIYLEEGENNDKFVAHPSRRESLPAYILAHTKWFYILDWVASLFLLLLAIVESPTIFQVPIGVHASIELGALTIITFGVVLKLRWLGFKMTLSHQRTFIKSVILVIMFIESMLVLSRQQSHFRVTRALRPIFIIDNRYLRGMRRFSRQVLQSLPPILDMLLLLLFFILLYSLLGNLLFSQHNPFFATAEDSFVNLFVLLTTANFPDIMMPSYYNNSFSVLYFASYIVTVIYLFMNLLLAVVYDAFTSIEKEKFRKLIIHKRAASNFAFNLLVSKRNPHGIIFRHFYGLMSYFDPNKCLRDVYLTFRLLNTSTTGVLSREEFSKFYEAYALKWKAKNVNGYKWSYLGSIGSYLQKFIDTPYSNHFFNAVILANGIATLVHSYMDTSQASWDSYFFSIFFLLEIFVKIVVWGGTKFFSSGWNIFDMISSFIFFMTLIYIEIFGRWSQLLAFIRPLRTFRLFKLKKRYRNIFGTVFILLPPMTSVAIVILLLYYFFAIIGMEIFGKVQLINCCNDTIFEDYYKDVNNTENSTSIHLRYYLNSFQDIFSSYVTLFELTVVNNWYVIMEGFRIASGNSWSRIYFIIFYLVTMCLLTVVIAFILDTFLFRMQYKRGMDKKTEQKMLRKEVILSGNEVDFCSTGKVSPKPETMKTVQEYEGLGKEDSFTFVGRRRRNKEILLKRMFRNEIQNWIRETEPLTSISEERVSSL